MRFVNWSVGGPTATERHLLADVRLLDGVTLVVPERVELAEVPADDPGLRLADA